MNDLKSSVSKKGKLVTQIITGTTGIKKTIHGIITSTIEESTMTHFETEDGRLIFVNKDNVFLVETFSEK
jgi:hypothetical protein